METSCVETMSDDGLLDRVERLVAQSNELLAELLAYLIEVERRQLHLREACSSMFAFCVERLHMSESAAGKRITAARTARRFPLVLEMIARGDIHLTAVNMLAAHLTEENCAEVLARARHRSKRQIEVLVAEIAPRPDVASRIIPLPQRPASMADVAAPPVAATEVGQEVRAPERVDRPAVVAPLSPRRYEIRVTVDEETHGKLMQLMDVLAHSGVRDPAEIVSRGIALLHEKTLAKKAALVARPRASKPAQKRTRHIPAAVERAVWMRDQGRCAFVDGKGRRCSATAWLEFHHLANWGRGAEHTIDQIELRCRAHNQYQAELDYGADFHRRAPAKRTFAGTDQPRRCLNRKPREHRRSPVPSEARMAVFVRARRRGALAVCSAVAAVLVGRCAWSSGSPPHATSPTPLAHRAPSISRLDALRARIDLARNHIVDWRIGHVPSVRVQGEVLLDGEPVAGADVRVAAELGLEGTATTTDDHGRFDLGYQDPLLVRIVARLGSERGEREVDLAEHIGAGRAWLAVALEPCEQWKKGRVIDRDRRPLAGVPLLESMGWTPVLVEAGRSASDGSFAVCAHVLVAGGGSLGRVEVRQIETDDVVLAPPMTVRGQVVGPHGDGVSGAFVDVSPRSGDGARVTARTGRDGKWSASVEAGCVALSARYRGQYGSLDRPGPPRECFGPEPLELCGESRDTIVAPSILVQGNTGTTRGVVRVDGKPAPGLVVMAGYQRDLTDGAGRFAFEDAVGSVEVIGHVLASRTDASGEDTFIELDATSTPRIHGRVTMAGQPAWGARVRIGSAPDIVYRIVAVTARDGSYSAQVSPGTIFVGADGPSGISTPTPEPGYIIDRADSRIDIELGAPTSIHGSVRTMDGPAAPGVHLMLYRSPTGPFPIGETHSDAHGFFQLAPRPGRYWLEVARSWSLARGGNQMEVVVPESGAVDLDLTIQPSE